MNWQTVLAVLFLELTAFLGFLMAAYAWRRREVRWALPFAALTLGLGIWSAFYGLELLAPDLAAKTRWAQLQYIGIATIPLAWFLFAMSYAGRDVWLRRSRVLALAVIPVLTVLMAFTNAWHGLHWAEITINSDGPFSIFDATYGSFWYLFTAYSYTLLAAGTVVLVLALLQYPAAYRWQLVILLAAPILPWLGNFLYISNLSPIPQLDLSAFAFTFSVLIIGLGIIRFRIFSVVPVARTTVLDQMSEAMLVLDPDNQIVDLNPAARTLLGVDGEQPVGLPITRYLGNWGEARRLLATLQTDEELRVPVGNMQQHYRLRITPLRNQRDQLVGRLVMVRDITRDKQAEQALTMARVKTEFYAKVGHELRTPLNSILGLAEMLEYGVYGPVTAEQREVVQSIVNQTEHLTKLLNDMLQQARLETHGFTLEMVTFEPRELLARVESGWRAAAQRKGLDLRGQMEPDVPPAVVGDPDRLYQILVNLVDNAIRYTPTGEVVVRISCPDSRHWALAVSDTGPGIPPEWQTRIFEPFEQAEIAATREDRPGIGLGLAIVKQLVELMEGEIQLESDLGRGSTFRVLLPLQAPAPPQRRELREMQA